MFHIYSPQYKYHKFLLNLDILDGLRFLQVLTCYSILDFPCEGILFCVQHPYKRVVHDLFSNMFMALFGTAQLLRYLFILSIWIVMETLAFEESACQHPMTLVRFGSHGRLWSSSYVLLQLCIHKASSVWTLAAAVDFSLGATSLRCAPSCVQSDRKWKLLRFQRLDL